MTKQVYEWKTEGDCANLYKDGKIAQSKLSLVRYGDMNLKPSTASSPQRFYNIIIKLSKRIAVLQAEFDAFSFTNGVQLGSYTVYGRGKCSSYYGQKNVNMLMVKKKGDRYDSYEGLWACPEDQVMDEFKRIASCQKDKYIALFEKVSEASHSEAVKIAESMMKKEVKKKVEQITRKQKKNANLTRAFLVSNNLMRYRMFLYSCVDTYADLIMRNRYKNKYKKFAYEESIVVMFPEINKALVVNNRDKNRERLVDMVSGIVIEEEFKVSK